MPWKNKTKEWIKNYNKEAMKRWRVNHPEHLEKDAKNAQQYRKNLKIDVFTHYGGNPPKCACCSEKEFLFLSLDHIYGGGHEDRKKFKGVTFLFYRWLIKNNYPDGFQVLCMNCNWGKHMNSGVCPHKKSLS